MRCDAAAQFPGAPDGYSLHAAFPIRCTQQQFLRTEQGWLAEASQHGGKFGFTRRTIKRNDVDERALAGNSLLHAELAVPVRRHLWQMRHADDLMLLREQRELLSDDLAASSTNTHVDLVKNQRRNRPSA